MNLNTLVVEMYMSYLLPSVEYASVVWGGCSKQDAQTLQKIQNEATRPGLQIYGGPRSLSHYLKIWPITFQGSGPGGPILFSCENISL